MTYCLENNTFKSLQTLYLTQYDCSKEPPCKVTMNLTECIKHAPSLNHLVLEPCYVHLKFTEVMHSSFAKLTSAVLQRVLIRITDRKLSRSIVPAPKFLNLVINFECIISDCDCVFSRVYS
ncbi:hypothetical protein K501DRAFT_270924 [Backusella circina FSU 941]|nr:hypothetical protein K501DRAFT_270924 [Backusella circina FSU 941]